MHFALESMMTNKLTAALTVLCAHVMSVGRTRAMWGLSVMGVMLAPYCVSPARAADEPPLERIFTMESKGRAGTLDHLFVDSDAARLFLTNQTNNTLDVFDLKNRRLLTQVVEQETAHSVVYVPGQKRIFVGCGAGVCNVLDGETYALIKSLPVPGADSVRYDQRSGRIAVASRKGLTLIDSRSLEIIVTIPLPGTPHGFQMARTRPRIYVNTEPPTQIAVIDAEKQEIVANLPIAGGSKSIGPITLDEVHGRILVGLRASPRFVVLDIDTGKETASLPIPEGADDMFLDADLKRIFISSSAGFVTVIRQKDADHYEHIADVATPKGAKTSFYDSAAKRLFVAVPRQADKEGPEIWGYRVAGGQK